MPKWNFCVCGIGYGFMVECSSGTGGCNGWFHPACCGLSLAEEQLQRIENYTFTCSLCSQVQLGKLPALKKKNPNRNTKMTEHITCYGVPADHVSGNIPVIDENEMSEERCDREKSICFGKTKIHKLFPKFGTFTGTVIGLQNGYYKIRYEDGDEEEMSWRFLLRYVQFSDDDKLNNENSFKSTVTAVEPENLKRRLSEEHRTYSKKHKYEVNGPSEMPGCKEYDPEQTVKPESSEFNDEANVDGDDNNNKHGKERDTSTLGSIRKIKYNSTLPLSANACKQKRVPNLSGPKCLVCNKTASFGFALTKKKEYCKEHKKEGAINLSTRKCATSGCNMTGNFCHQGERLKFCKAHKSGKMEHISAKWTESRKNIVGSCGRIAQISTNTSQPQQNELNCLVPMESLSSVSSTNPNECELVEEGSGGHSQPEGSVGCLGPVNSAETKEVMITQMVNMGFARALTEYALQMSSWSVASAVTFICEHNMDELISQDFLAQEMIQTTPILNGNGEVVDMIATLAAIV